MEAKKFLAAIALLAILLVAGCTQPQNNNNNQNGDSSGTMLLAVTHAAADMGSVSSVRMTVDRVRVYSQTEGWVTVSSTPKTYDLLALDA